MGSGEADYNLLIRPIEGALMKSVYRIVQDPHDAEDAFQEGLAKVWIHLAKIRRHPNPHALILRIFANAARDALRKRIRRVRREGSGPASAARAGDEDHPLRAIDRARVLSAIAELPRRQAEVLLMRVVQEQSYEVIAKAIGCSEATARTHALRGRGKLAESLADLNPKLGAEVQS
jgi:RNA polymerase sigma factor (sigma-70 family)